MKKLLHSKTLVIISISLVALLVYYPSLYGKFMWDDEQQIVNHIYIRSFSNIPLFFKGSTFYLKQEHLIGVFYRPLMTAVYTLIYPFSSGKPFLYHAVQLAFHILNTIVIFYVFTFLLNYISNKLKRAHVLSLFTALIFLVHPMNSEVVSYIANMQDVLFFFFGICALLIGIKVYSQVFAILISSILLLSSLFSKETGVLFIPLILCYIYLFKRKDLLKYTVAYTVVFSVYMTIRCFVAKMCHSHTGPNPIAKLPFLKYLMQLPAVMFYYIEAFFFPKNLAIGQHWWVKALNGREFFLPLLALFIFFGIIIFIWLLLHYRGMNNTTYKRAAYVYTFFSVWFLLGLIMHMHIMPLDFTVADRWFYFSMAGLLGIMGTYLVTFSDNKIYTYYAFFLVILILSIVCWYRNTLWHNTFKLYMHDYALTRDSFDLENNIGVEFYRKKQYGAARTYFKKAVDVAPDWPISLANLAVTYEREHNDIGAEQYYRRAIKNNVYYPAYVGYIRVLMNQNKRDDAQQFLIKKALISFPNDADLLEYKKELKQSTKAL